MQSQSAENASTAPSPPAKTGRFYYGWVVLAVASIANTIAFGAGSGP